ncbi:MAG: LamG-like jellyroll fold domain-containing protein [Myxococcota bacterium]
MRWALVCGVLLGGCTFGGAGGQAATFGAPNGDGDTSSTATPATGAPGDGGDDEDGAPPPTAGNGETSAPDDDGGTTLDADGATDDTKPDDGGSSEDGDPGTTGGDPTALIEDGLVVRYFLDEANMGSPNGSTVFDHGPAPALDLTLVSAGGEPEYFTDASGNHGLEWSGIEQNGRAIASIDNLGNTKIIDALDGAAELTIEVIAFATGVTDHGSRLLHIGGGKAQHGGRLAVASEFLNEIELRWEHANPLAIWNVPVDDARALYTITLDVAQDPQARLYVNGNEVDPIFVDYFAGQTVDINPSDALALGNRHDGQRSFQGRLFYAAIYDRALTPTEVKTNASALGDSDDEP